MVIGTSWPFGGHRVSGVAVTRMAGGVVSRGWNSIAPMSQRLVPTPGISTRRCPS